MQKKKYKIITTICIEAASLKEAQETLESYRKMISCNGLSVNGNTITILKA